MAEPALSSVRLYRMETPEHACPWGRRALALLRAEGIPFEDRPLRSQAEVEAFKHAHGVTTTPQVFAGAERIGGYSELAKRLGVAAETAEVSYAPVIAVFLSAVLINLALGGGIRSFMGLAICLLAMLKLMDIAAFAASFRKYDLLTKRCQVWEAVSRRRTLGGSWMLRSAEAGAGRLGWSDITGSRRDGHGVRRKSRVIGSPALNCACMSSSRTPLEW